MTPETKSAGLMSWLPVRLRAEEAAAALPDLLMTAERAASAIAPGGHRRRRAGGGERFWQFREYDPSDRPQDIDWRQSARGDRVFVRQREWQTAQTVLFWAQGGPGMSWRSARSLPEKRTDAIVLSLALGILLARQNELVGVLEGGGRPGRNAPAIHALGRDLMMPAAALPGPAAENVPAGAGIVLAGDFLSDIDETRRTMDRLSARAGRGLMIQVLDPAEIALPYAGRVIFEEPGGARDHRVEKAESVRDAYARRIDGHCRALRSVCARHRWEYVLHHTGANVADTLLEAWGRLDAKASGKGEI